MDLAIHDIDVTQWVTCSHYLTVSAFTGCPSGRPQEDLVTVSGVLYDGTVTSHLVNWLSPMKERIIAVTGDRGRLLADTLATELWFHRNGAVTDSDSADRPFHGTPEADLIRYAVTRREALTVELENFRDAVLGKPADIVTMQQGVDTVEVAAAVLAASRGGTTVSLANWQLGFAGVPAQAFADRPRAAHRPAG